MLVCEMGNEELKVGKILADKYRLLEKVGEGGMGAVWKAEHLTLGRQVAIKVILPDLATRGEMAARFRREAQAVAALKSPYIVQVHDYIEGDVLSFIVMELLQGESLEHRIQREGHLSPAATLQILTEVGRGVHHAHENRIIHRDLKPANIFLVRNADGECAKVVDFGIAKFVDMRMTATGVAIGSPYYMSPEQHYGYSAVDHRADIWALGVIAAECLTGRKPFDGETIQQLRAAICTGPLPIFSMQDSVPAGFDQWFSRACAREPNAGFSTAREAIDALRRVCIPRQSELVYTSNLSQNVVETWRVAKKAYDDHAAERPDRASLGPLPPPIQGMSLPSSLYSQYQVTHQKVVDALEELARSGHIESILLLGKCSWPCMCLRDWAVTKHSLEWAICAGKLGHSDGYMQAGQIVRFGGAGTAPPDAPLNPWGRGSASLAAKWFKLAGELGNVEGFLACAQMSYQAKDFVEAFKYFAEAANRGCAGAQLCLGRMYALGLGVERSWEEAEKWLIKAAAQGDARAVGDLQNPTRIKSV